MSVTSDLVVKAIVAIGVGGLRAWTVTAAVESFNTIHYEKATNTLQARLTF